MAKVQVKIRDHNPDLGLRVEPPVGIEPTTYALRVRSGSLVVVVLVLVGRPWTSVVVRRCSPAWLLGWLLGQGW